MLQNEMTLINQVQSQKSFSSCNFFPKENLSSRMCNMIIPGYLLIALYSNYCLLLKGILKNSVV